MKPYDTMIRVRLNGEERDFPAGLTVKQALEYVSLKTDRIAVEVNQKIIRRGEWERVELKDRDIIEVVHFVGGGNNTDHGF